MVPYKQLLINRSTKNDNDDHQNIIQLTRYLSQDLNDSSIIQDIHYVTMLLHPNLKSFYLIPTKKEHAVALVKLELNKLLDSTVVKPLQTTTSNNQGKKTVKKNMHSMNSLDEIHDVPDDKNHVITSIN